MEDQILIIKRELKSEKAILTKLLNKISPETSTSSVLQTLYDDACKRFENIKVKQDQLVTLARDEESDELATTVVDYQVEISGRLAVINDMIKIQTDLQPDATPETNRGSVTQNLQIKMPEISLPKFSDNHDNLFNYVNFKSAFKNALAAAPNMLAATKFLYLRSQLEGKAYSLIENLAVDETTYEVALGMLDKEYLNRSEIFNATLSTFINQNPANSLEAACQIVLNFKTNLTELRKINYNFDEGEATKELLSMLLRNKLPKFFTVEIARTCNCSNPSYLQILDNYQQVRRLLTDNKRVAPKSGDTDRIAPMQYRRQPDNNRLPQRVQGQGRLNVGANKSDSNVFKACKFCKATGHYSAGCNTYKTPEQRANRARELKLCWRCLSPKHTAETCAGVRNKLPFECKICRSHEHVTPVCKGAGNSRLVNSTTD